jgi:hypothetical protein
VQFCNTNPSNWCHANLKMSPRIKDIPNGNKHPVHRPEEQNVIAPESAAPNGNVFSSFPGPVKFPTLIDLEKCEKSYPEIHADIIQEVVVKTRSVPLEVVPIELLKSRKENTWHTVGSSQVSEDQEVVHFHSHGAAVFHNTIQIIYDSNIGFRVLCFRYKEN